MATDRKPMLVKKDQAKDAQGAGSRAVPTRDRLLHEAITRRAYELYETAGRPNGQALAHWLQAEAEVLAR